MPWTFEITTGKLYDAGGNCVATGYSGATRERILKGRTIRRRSR